MFANWFEDSWNTLYGSPFFWWIVAGVGVVIVLLAVLLYVGPKARMSGIVLSIVGSLAVGIALGILIMGTAGYDLKKPPTEGGENAGGDGQNMMGGGGGGRGMMGGGGGGGRGMMGGGGGGGRGMMGGGGGGGGVSKFQLVNLVDKLDVLTEKPLQIELTADEKQKVKTLLAELGDVDKLSDKDAQEKLDSLLKVVEPKKDTLTAAGYNWPGEGGRGRGGNPGGGGRGMMGGGGGGGRGMMGGGGGGELPEGLKKAFDDHRQKLMDRLGKTNA